MTPEYIVIHHSLTQDGLVVDWEGIRRYHKDTNGWTDIGYHHGIERVNGAIVAQVGRPEFIPGAHCKEAGMNGRSIGICVVGNFDLSPPGLEMLRALRDLCNAVMVNYGIPAGRVIGHREAGLMAGFDWRKAGPTGIPQYKSCPGKLFPMSSLRDFLAGTIA